MPAVNNTSPIFNLACINRLPLLPEQFGDVWIPKAVDDELRKIPDTLTRQTVEQASQDGWLKTRRASNASLIRTVVEQVRQGNSSTFAKAPADRRRFSGDWSGRSFVAWPESATPPYFERERRPSSESVPDVQRKRIQTCACW